MKTVLVALFALALPLTAQAGAKVVGNGGDVIYCPNRTPQAELLDFYEARTSREMIIPVIPGGTYQEKLTNLLKTVSARFPIYAGDWQKEAAAFESNANFQPGVILNDIPDSDHLSVPVGCEIRQIVIQSKPRFPGDKLYTVSKDLWDQLDDNNRAGLVLHELVFKTALAGGAENSIGARYVNSALFTAQLQTFTDRQLAEIFWEARIQLLEVLFPDGSVQVPLYRKYEESEFEKIDYDYSADGSLTGRKRSLVSEDPLNIYYLGQTLKGVRWNTPLTVGKSGLQIDRFGGNLTDQKDFFIIGLELGNGQTCFLQSLETEANETRVEIFPPHKNKKTKNCFPGNPIAKGFAGSFNWADLLRLKKENYNLKVSYPVNDLAAFFGNISWRNTQPFTIGFDSSDMAIEVSVKGTNGTFGYKGKKHDLEFRTAHLSVDAEGRLLGARLIAPGGRIEIQSPFGVLHGPTSFALGDEEVFLSAYFAHEPAFTLRFSFGQIDVGSVSCREADGHCRFNGQNAKATMQGKELPVGSSQYDMLVNSEGWLRGIMLEKAITLKYKDGRSRRVPANYVWFTRDGLVE